MKEEFCRGGKITEAGLYARIFNVFVIGWVLVLAACDQVKETPEPDQFAQTELVNIAVVSDTNGEASLDVLGHNKLKEAVTISFSKPLFGSIVADPATSMFRYKAKKGVSGVDSFSYKVCRTTLCKSGLVKIKVEQPDLPCVPTFAANGSYHDTVQAANYMTSKLHPGDILCPENQLSFISSSLVGPVTLDYNGFHFGLPPSTFTRDTEVRFFYSVCDKNYQNCSEIRSCSTIIKINDTYCDKIFKVNDLEFPIRAKKNKPYRFERHRAIQAVCSCDDDLDSTYFHVYASPLEAIVVYSEQTGSYIITPPDSVSKRAKIHYEFKNKRGLKDNGQAIINFNY